MMSKVKNLNYGVMLLQSHECRGLDIKFNKDALVLIIAKVETFSEYHQMLGRSSRTRDVCDGIMYTSTSEKAC